MFQNKNDGSLLRVEQLEDGNFVTPVTNPPSTNQSPGACNTSPRIGNGGTVADGIQGSFHGYLVISLPSGITQTSKQSLLRRGNLDER